MKRRRLGELERKGKVTNIYQYVSKPNFVHTIGKNHFLQTMSVFLIEWFTLPILNLTQSS